MLCPLIYQRVSGGGMFLYTAFVATEKPKEEDEAR